MKQASVQAHAKINLTLDVTGRRPNGYHDVCMVMQSIGIHDIVTVSTGTGVQAIELTISHCDLPADNSNLAYRAAELFLRTTHKEYTFILKSIIRLPQALREAVRTQQLFWYCSMTCMRQD